MEYDEQERTVFSELYMRWVGFMKYVNHKSKTIDENFLREYCNFLGNVALRFGGIDAINRTPEIPNEVIGQYVREYEVMLVEWTKVLADIERREARFLKNRKNKKSEQNNECIGNSINREENEESLTCDPDDSKGVTEEKDDESETTRKRPGPKNGGSKKLKG